MKSITPRTQSVLGNGAADGAIRQLADEIVDTLAEIAGASVQGLAISPTAAGRPTF